LETPAKASAPAPAPEKTPAQSISPSAFVTLPPSTESRPPSDAPASASVDSSRPNAPLAPNSASSEITPASAEAAHALNDAAFQQAFESGIEQLATLLDESPVHMSKVYSVVLKAALEGFRSQEGLLLTRHRDGAYVPALGQGVLFKELRERSLVRETDRDVFGLCLQRLEDVFIYDASEAKITPHIPPWMRPAKLASFVLLPIHENRRPFALLLAGWPEKKTKNFSVAQIRQVRSLLKLVGTARRLSES
jgi:hypothetical protein